MSFILDALRKADAQRERDPARGIHAHSVQLASSSTGGRLSDARRLWLAGSLLLAVLLLTAGWYVSRADPAQPAPAPAAPVSARALASAPIPLVSGVVPAAAVQPPPAPRADQTPEQASRTRPAARGQFRSQLAQNDPATGQPRTARGAAAADRAQGAAPPVPAPVTPAIPMSAPAMPAPAAPAPPNPAAAPAPAAPAPPAAPVPASVAATPTPGLPPDAPKIAISGGVYSASPAQRMLIVNGQVFNEGSEVAPGVTVEEIKARTVVLKFRGTRYMIAY